MGCEEYGLGNCGKAETHVDSGTQVYTHKASCVGKHTGKQNKRGKKKTKHRNYLQR